MAGRLAGGLLSGGLDHPQEVGQTRFGGRLLDPAACLGGHDADLDARNPLAQARHRPPAVVGVERTTKVHDHRGPTQLVALLQVVGDGLSHGVVLHALSLVVAVQLFLAEVAAVPFVAECLLERFPIGILGSRRFLRHVLLVLNSLQTVLPHPLGQRPRHVGGDHRDLVEGGVVEDRLVVLEERGTALVGLQRLDEVLRAQPPGQVALERLLLVTLDHLHADCHVGLQTVDALDGLQL